MVAVGRAARSCPASLNNGIYKHGGRVKHLNHHGGQPRKGAVSAANWIFTELWRLTCCPRTEMERLFVPCDSVEERNGINKERIFAVVICSGEGVFLFCFVFPW